MPQEKYQEFQKKYKKSLHSSNQFKVVNLISDLIDQKFFFQTTSSYLLFEVEFNFYFRLIRLFEILKFFKFLLSRLFYNLSLNFFLKK